MTRRSVQSAACQGATRAQVAGGRRHDAERLRDALAEVGDVAGDPERDDADQRRAIAAIDEVEEQRAREEPGEVEALAAAAARRDPGSSPSAHRPGEEEARREHVEEAQDERARDDRRVGASRDRAVREDDAHGVARARRDDRVDPDARRGTRRRSRSTGRGSSGYAAASTFRQARLVQAIFSEVAADRERERDEVDRPELVEERVDPVEDAN